MSARCSHRRAVRARGGGAAEPRPESRRQLLMLPALLLCFGALGLLWLLPAWRRRRAMRTPTERHRVGTRVFVALAVLLCAGAVTRAHTALSPPEVCHSRIAASGQITPEPLLPAATAGSPVWNTVRRVVVAPPSGLALLASQAAGQHRCSGPPFTVTFSWPPNDNGGSTVGDTFVTWIPSDSSDRSEQQRRIRGTGLSSETSFVRFGPNLSSDRLDEQRLAEHETRHLDQWAVFSVAGGPLAFQLAYWADSLLFPRSRSHFERDAGLAEGGYPEPDGTGPAPLWGPLTVLLAVLLLLARSRGWRLTPDDDRAEPADVPTRDACRSESGTGRYSPSPARGGFCQDLDEAGLLRDRHAALAGANARDSR